MLDNLSEWLTPEFLLAMTGLITAIGGNIATWASARSAKVEEGKRAEQDCKQRVRAAWDEAETATAELHRLRMTGWPSPEEQP